MNNVDHPAHYNQGGIEVIDFIEDAQLDFHRGNAIKYIIRHKYKNSSIEKQIQDLEKALWYIKRYQDKCEPKYKSTVSSISSCEFAQGHGLSSDLVSAVMQISNINPYNAEKNLKSAIKYIEKSIKELKNCT